MSSKDDAGDITEVGSQAIEWRPMVMIISNRINISPCKVKAMREERPAMADVTTTGTPSEKWGNIKR